MSIGIFFVGLIVGIAVFLFGIALICQHDNWDILGFITMFVGISIFGFLFILSLAFPKGFEEIKNNIRGTEQVELELRLTDDGELSDDDKKNIAEIKTTGFEISSIYDKCSMNSRGNINKYRVMTLIRPKSRNLTKSLSKKYEMLNNEN